jgi:PAT family beta-lactamase induction signal transducer AmpG
LKQGESHWREAVFNRRMLICVFTGLASGMPLYVLFQLVPAWLHDEGVSLAEIGLFALVGIPYTWKFLWAPLMDRWIPPFLGRRRGWMLIFQLALLVSIGALGMLQPSKATWVIAWLAAAVAFFSASQDIALDAYRREILPDVELGLGNSIHVQAYRISSLVPGSLSLILADILPWGAVFWITAAFMLVGVLMTLLISEPETELPAGTSLRNILVAGDGGVCSWYWVSCFSIKSATTWRRPWPRLSTWTWDSVKRRSAWSPSTRPCGRRLSAACWAD